MKTKGVWQIIASPADDPTAAYLVSYHKSRDEAYRRRDDLAKADASTKFVVLMVILEDAEYAEEDGLPVLDCCNGEMGVQS